MLTEENLILGIYSLTRFATRPSPYKDQAGWHFGCQHIWIFARSWPDIYRILAFFINLIIKLAACWHIADIVTFLLACRDFSKYFAIPSCFSSFSSKTDPSSPWQAFALLLITRSSIKSNLINLQAVVLLSAASCHAGLLGAGTGEGSCAAAPFRLMMLVVMLVMCLHWAGILCCCTFHVWNSPSLLIL